MSVLTFYQYTYDLCSFHMKIELELKHVMWNSS